jgi:hypothetical protein
MNFLAYGACPAGNIFVGEETGSVMYEVMIRQGGPEPIKVLLEGPFFPQEGVNVLSQPGDLWFGCVIVWVQRRVEDKVYAPILSISYQSKARCNPLKASPKSIADVRSSMVNSLLANWAQHRRPDVPYRMRGVCAFRGGGMFSWCTPASGLSRSRSFAARFLCWRRGILAPEARKQISEPLTNGMR